MPAISSLPRIIYGKKVARVTGLEPATSGVTGRRSNQLSYTPTQKNYQTIYAHPNDKSRSVRQLTGHNEWWAVTGSNRRPSRCKRDALPAELTALEADLLNDKSEKVNQIKSRPIISAGLNTIKKLLICWQLL